MKKISKLLLALICLFINVEVFAYYSSDPEYNGGYVMPDLYNTGPITPKSELVDFPTKYPEITCADAFCRITSKTAEKYGYVFEGFKTTKTILINGVSNVTIRDFYIETDNTYGIQIVDWNNMGTPTNIIIEDGEIKGTSSAAIIGANTKMRRIYIHEYGADAIKIASNQLIESNYIASGGLKEGAHADGVQLTGSAFNVKIYGNRFDMIGSFDNYKANATLFLQLEKDEANNVEVAHNWLNGGGYTIYVNEYQEGKFTGIKFKDNKIGNGRRFGYMASNFTDAAKANIIGMNTFIYAENIDIPFVGSIVYYNQNGKRVTDLKDVNHNMKIITNIANYTSNEQNITLVAKLYNYKGELVNTYKQTNSIKRNMPGREYITDKGNKLQEISMSDFPQNIPTVLEINNLPTNLDGHYITVEVYKNGISDKTLRTSKITSSIKKEYKLVGLSIETKKTTYKVGEVLKKENFVVKALYSDNSSKVVNDYTLSTTSPLTLNTKIITITYNDNGTVVNKNVNIIVNDKASVPEKNEILNENAEPENNEVPNENIELENNQTSNENEESENNKTLNENTETEDDKTLPESTDTETENNEIIDESTELENNEKVDEIIDFENNENEDTNNLNTNENIESLKQKNNSNDSIYNSKNVMIIIAGLCIISSLVVIWYHKKR